MASSIHDTDAVVRIQVEIRLPRHDARAFLDAMTGNDDDVLLAAERAIRDRIESEDVELWYGDAPERNVREYVEAEAHAEQRSQVLYGPPA